MSLPYDITLKDGEMPSITINAPALEAQPHAWRKRIQWAWRCLRGKPIDIFPSVNIINNIISSQDGPALTVRPKSRWEVKDSHFIVGGEDEA